jgi:hypothetical protein
MTGEDEPKVYIILPGRMPPLLPYVKKVFKIRGTSKGKLFQGSVQDDGTIRVQRKVYESPSAAAAAVTGYPGVDGIQAWPNWREIEKPSQASLGGRRKKAVTT